MPEIPSTFDPTPSHAEDSRSTSFIRTPASLKNAWIVVVFTLVVIAGVVMFFWHITNPHAEVVSPLPADISSTSETSPTFNVTSLDTDAGTITSGSPENMLMIPDTIGQRTITIMTKFYCYTFEAEPDLDCIERKAEVDALLLEINRIWEKAGIQWELESDVITKKKISAVAFPPLTGNETSPQIRQRLIKISPKEETELLKVVILGRIPDAHGGVYNPETQTIYIAQPPDITSESIATTTSGVVFAHELGHSLSLPHATSTDQYNVMYVTEKGAEKKPNRIDITKKTRLTEQQILTARFQAVRGPATLDEMPRVSHGPQMSTSEMF